VRSGAETVYQFLPKQETETDLRDDVVSEPKKEEASDADRFAKFDR